MPDARYFLPDQPDLTGVYSRDDLRHFLQSGRLSRSDMVLDDQTGMAHLLGALLASPHHLGPTVRGRPEEQENEEGEESHPAPQGAPDENRTDQHQEFRASTPLRSWESREADEEPLDDDEYYEEDEEDDEDGEEELAGEAPPQAAVPPPAVAPIAAKEEEELVYHGHPSWFSYPRCLTGFVVLAGAAVACQRFNLGLAPVITCGALSLLCLAFVALDRMTTEYFITTRRVETVSGLVGRNSKEIRITDIRAIDVTQQGFGAVLGVGMVDFFSSAGGKADVCFVDVRRPHRLKQTIRELQA